MAKTVQWTGSRPVSCELCGCQLGDSFVDGKTRGGPWGKMCVLCHSSHGVGLGLGRGQLYRKNAKSEWWKEVT